MELTGTDIRSTRPGNVTVSIVILGIQLDLTLRLAQVAATLDTDNSDTTTDKGVALNDGQLGGVLRVDELYGTINNFAAENCQCVEGIDADTDLIVGYEDDLMAATCSVSGDNGLCQWL